MPTVKFTPKLLEELEPRDRPYAVRDAVVPGLLCVVNRRSKTLAVQADLRTGPRGATKLVRTIRHTLCRLGDHDLHEVRLRAKEAINLIRRGVDVNATPGLVRGSAGEPRDATVKEVVEAAARDMEVRQLQPRTIHDMKYRHGKYLADWQTLPAREITRQMARARHQKLAKDSGKRTANMVFVELGSAYRIWLKSLDDVTGLGNPVEAVTFFPAGRSNKVINVEELPRWNELRLALTNPLRRELHLFMIISGMRSEAARSIRLEQIDLAARAIRFDRLKGGRPWALPLSSALLECVVRAQELGKVLYPGSPWLWPTRDRDGRVTHIRVLREKNGLLAGHITRHTMRSLGALLGIDRDLMLMLVDHKLRDLDSTYVHQSVVWARMLKAQEELSAFIMNTLSGT